MTRSYEQLVDAYTALDSRDIGSRDGLLDVRSGIKALQAKLKEFAAEVEEALIEHITAHGDIDIGEGKRLYIGVQRDYRCRDNAATFVAVLGATGGDETLMAEALSSGAWKPGACRKLLGDTFVNHFEETVAQDLKTGSARKIVKTFDPAFGGGA